MTFLGGAFAVLWVSGFLSRLDARCTGAAQAFFEGSDLPYAQLPRISAGCGGVPLLWTKEPEPDIHEETGSLLSTRGY